MKSVQCLLAALLFLVSPVILAEKPDPVDNPPLQVREQNLDESTQAIRVREQGTVEVDIVDTEELDVNVTGGQIDADVTGSTVEVINPEFSPLMVSEGPFYGYKVVENRGCNVAWHGSTVSASCSPGGFQPQVIEQISLNANLSGTGVSEGILFVTIKHDDNPLLDRDHVIPLETVGGTLFGTHLTRLYVPENYQVSFQVQADTSIGTGAARINWSGYRVIED